MLHEKAKLQESLGECFSLGSVWRSRSWHALCSWKEMGKANSKCKRWVNDKGIADWNQATELLKQHSGSKWHQDSSITARMAKHVEQQNVIELQCAGVAKQDEDHKKKNCEIILKLMRSIYFRS